MNLILYCIFLPIALSLPCFVFKRWAKWITLASSAAVAILAGRIFLMGISGVVLNFRIYVLSSGCFLAAAVFSFLIVLYSLTFIQEREWAGEYFAYVLITLGAAAGAFFANDYFTLIFFWGMLGATLYMLIGITGPQAAAAAKKTFIIIGGTDALMIFGIGIIWLLTKSMLIGHSPIPLDSSLPTIAFLCMISGAFAKAGAIPFHSWIPDSAEVAPVPVMALLPASLDKLLGIYLLTRVCLDIFILIPNSAVSMLLMVVGSFTIIIAVMAALVQHNLKKLLSFHAVSQVGYMVLGIGTALPVGIAGGIFHMLNHAIYKSCLFLAGGAIEKNAKTTELEGLGGLAGYMPLTFISSAVAALSISGVPPFNGFVSKWMIYQGVIELARTSSLWVIWLTAAMFGSALTLASFVKMMHAVFLGQSSRPDLKVKEAHFSMWLPMVALASLCLIFGVFAYQLPLSYFVLPVINVIIYVGFWDPSFATALILIGLLIGLSIFWFGRSKSLVIKPAYIGGELADESSVKVPGTDFYNTIRDHGPLKWLYKNSERKIFDVYEQGSKLVFSLYDVLGRLHNGLLQTYVAWMFLGIIFLLLMFK